jgi:hypothetical protein
MANFFSKYPKLLINNRLVTDLIARTAIRDKYSDRLSIFYPYQLQEGDTPELIAFKYYGDAEKHWIVLLANDIINPFFDFPLSYIEFNKMLDQKYAEQGAALNITGSEYASATININPLGYRSHITTTDNISGVSTTETIYIDQKAYNGGVNGYDDDTFNFADSTAQADNITVTITKEQISIYDYESELNEAKREIKLIRKEYANQLETELKVLMREQYV